MTHPSPDDWANQGPAEAVFHDRFHNRLRFEGQLITRTGLHIGAGNNRNLMSTDHPVVRDAMGKPFIPGASLKGVLRSAAEALLRTFPRPRGNEKRPPLWACDSVGQDPCVSDERSKEIRQELVPPIPGQEPDADDLRMVVETIWEESCSVCRLFGSVALASRLRFPDLLLDATPPVEIRNGVGIDRDKEQAAKGVLYDFEAVPPGTEFSLLVLADNVKNFEVGLLLYLFDELHRGQLSLGGKTSRGLGQMEVAWTRIEETRLDADGGSNPFAQLLARHELLTAEAGESAEPVLPLPGDGDQELWRRLADGLDAYPAVDEAVLGDLIQKEALGNKAELNKSLALGLDKPRQYRKVILDRLQDCGRLVPWQGQLVPAAVAEEAQHDGAELDRRLQPLYQRFVGAMHGVWQEAS